MTRIYYNYTLQANTPHRDEEPQNIYINLTLVKQKQIKQRTLPLQDDCKARMDTKYCITKQRQTKNPHTQ